MTEFILNRETKYNITYGDIIHFRNGDIYIVTEIFEYTNGGISYTLRDVKTNQNIYCLQSSHCYGYKVTRDCEKYGYKCDSFKAWKEQ